MSHFNFGRLERLLSTAHRSERFGSDHLEDAIRPHGVEIETGMLLYALVRRVKPKIVVETGTDRGYGAAWLASALADNFDSIPDLGRGKLYTVDNDRHADECFDLWKSLGLEHYIERVIADSRTWQAPSLVDLLFIDSDHTFRSVMEEWRNYRPKLNRQGSYVVLHDTKIYLELKQAAREIVQREATLIRAIEFFSMRGLTVLNFGGCL